MLEKDKEFFQSLVKEYSILEILRALRHALVEESHSLSDMGLKEKSREAAEAADILYDVSLSYDR